MLSQADFPVAKAVETFAKAGLEAGYLSPTSTGLSKSIIDAHESLRVFLKSIGLHDYGSQRQGPDAKAILSVRLLTASDSVSTTASLYRPSTKSGDPRIWISGLPGYCSAGNLIALLRDPESPDGLVVINVSDAAIWSTRQDPQTPVGRVFAKPITGTSSAAEELLGNLLRVHDLGWVESQRPGDTGVGFTLETLLGIDANSSKAPDYKGIELKAGRIKPRGQSNRSSLFSQVPDWDLSGCKTAKSILMTYGYESHKTGRQELYCTVRSSPNPQSLFLTLGDGGSTVEVRSKSTGVGSKSVSAWRTGILQARLAEKHAHTFWVSAEVRISDSGHEEFRYRKVRETRSPLVANFGTLIEIDAITMDFTLSLRPTGTVRDHGYLFKIHPSNADLLFPPSVVYDLAVGAGR